MSEELDTSNDRQLMPVGLLDEVEVRLLEIGGVERPKGEAVVGIPQTHTFTPGLYAREVKIPAGTILTSKIHKTQHPFVISQGAVNVYLEDEARWELLQAPHLGVTQPGTRRLLVVEEDLVWTTFHPTATTDLEELEDELLADYVNPLLHALLEGKA